MPRPRPLLGFTLIEVLVALAILGIGLVAALRAEMTSTETAAALRSRQLAFWVAENQLALLRSRRQLPAVGEESAETTMGGENFVWRMTIGAMPQTAFRSITIRVFPVGRAEELARLESFVGAL